MIGTQNGISIFDGAKFKNINYLQGLPNNNVNEIYFDDSGDVLIATQRGVFKYNQKTFVRLDPSMSAMTTKWGTLIKLLEPMMEFLV